MGTKCVHVNSNGHIARGAMHCFVSKTDALEASAKVRGDMGKIISFHDARNNRDMYIALGSSFFAGGKLVTDMYGCDGTTIAIFRA